MVSSWLPTCHHQVLACVVFLEKQTNTIEYQVLVVTPCHTSVYLWWRLHRLVNACKRLTTLKVTWTCRIHAGTWFELQNSWCLPYHMSRMSKHYSFLLKLSSLNHISSWFIYIHSSYDVFHLGSQSHVEKACTVEAPVDLNVARRKGPASHPQSKPSGVAGSQNGLVHLEWKVRSPLLVRYLKQISKRASKHFKTMAISLRPQDLSPKLQVSLQHH